LNRASDNWEVDPVHEYPIYAIKPEDYAYYYDISKRFGGHLWDNDNNAQTKVDVQSSETDWVSPSENIFGDRPWIFIDYCDFNANYGSSIHADYRPADGYIFQGADYLQHVFVLD
jgi:hypothetical protein